jgi:antitoxin ParD1/3/4
MVKDSGLGRDLSLDRPDRLPTGSSRLDVGAAWSCHAAMTVKSSISLTDEQDAFIRSRVAARRRAPARSLQQGVDLLRRQMEADEADVAALRAILSERLEGPFISAEEMRARTEAMIARKRRDGPG